MKHIFKRNNNCNVNALINSLPENAFTIIEVLMVAAMIVTIIGAFFSLFSGTIRKVNIGDWKSTTQIKMRTAVKRLHMDISSATYPAMITLNKTIIEKDDKWNLLYKPGKTFFQTLAVDTENSTSNEEKLLEYYICIPGRDTPVQKKKRKIIKSVVTAQKINKKMALVMNKYLIEGDEVSGDLQKIILLEDVDFFSASHFEVPPLKANDPVNVVFKIELRAQHPQHPQTGLNESIDIPLNVQAAGNL